MLPETIISEYKTIGLIQKTISLFLSSNDLFYLKDIPIFKNGFMSQKGRLTSSHHYFQRKKEKLQIYHTFSGLSIGLYLQKSNYSQPRITHYKNDCSVE